MTIGGSLTFNNAAKRCKTMTPDVAVIYLILFGGHLLLLRRFVVPDLNLFGKRLLIVLYALHFGFIALHYAARGWGSFWSWYFDFRFGEYNPTATYAATLYALITLGSVVIALWGAPRRWWHRLYWLGVGTFFGYLGLDEYFQLHEEADNWTLIYGLAAAGLVLVSAAVYGYGLKRRDMRVFAMMIGGLGVAAAGGVGLETLAHRDCFGYVYNLCNRLPLIEETLENVGILTALLGVLLYATKHVSPAHWSGSRRLILSGGLISALVLIIAPWIVPNLEARLLAQPVEIEYLDGSLSVIGYQVSGTVLRPGDSLDLNLYWRTNGELYSRYGLSTHLVSRADGKSFARVDRIVEDPRFDQTAPGTVYRTRMNLTLPPDIPAPASYWLTLTVWQDRRPQFIMQPVSQTDRQLLTEDMAALLSLPVIADQDATSPLDHPLRYDFAGDFALVGHSIALENRQLNLAFGWETQASITQDFIQFLHIFDEDGNWVFGHDQPPLTDQFPTSDWPAGLSTRADWQLDLPRDLPPGDYHLRTGLYDALTRDRLPVTGSDGQPLQDYIIDLGTITLAG